MCQYFGTNILFPYVNKKKKNFWDEIICVNILGQKYFVFLCKKKKEEKKTFWDEIILLPKLCVNISRQKKLLPPNV